MHRLLSAAILSLLACAGFAAERNPRLMELKPNEWLYTDPQPSKRLVLAERRVDSPTREIVSKEPAFREYTSPAFGGGKLYYFGGGHSGYFGNDMEAYDPVANRWQQLTVPHCPARDDSTYYSGGSERSYLDPATGAGEPYVLHGYARTAFDHGLGAYVCTATFPEKTELDPATKQWKLVKQTFGLAAFDPKDNRWRLLAPTPGEVAPGSTSLAYDRDLGGMLAFAENGVFLFKAGGWSRFGPANIRLCASGGAGSVYLPEQKTHLIAVLGHGGAKEEGHLVWYDTAKKEGRRVESLPEELRRRIAPGTGAYNLVLAYDPGQKRVLALSANDELVPEVWLFDPATDRWTKLPTSPTAPRMPKVFEPGTGRAPLVYDPHHGVFFLIFRREEEARTWAYRPGRSEASR